MGIGEEVIGKLKEAAGKLTGKHQLQAEGEAQADKGAEERKAGQAEASATAHAKKADSLHRKQKAAE